MINYTVGVASILTGSVTRKWTVGSIIALSLCLFSSIVWAETRWTPLLNLSAVKDDNILFSQTDAIDDYVYEIEPGIKYEYDQEVTEFSANGRVRVRKYQDNDDLDDEIYRLWLNGNTDITERFHLQGKYDFISDTTLDSELEEIGRIFLREDRISHNASLAPSFNLNERMSIGLSANYRDVSYDTDEFVDYTSWNLGLPIRWRLATRVDSVYINPGYNYRESDSNTSDTYKIAIGWDHSATERLSVNSLVGVRYTELEKSGTSEMIENWNGLGSIVVAYDFERGRLTFDIEHDLRNSANGDQVNVSRAIIGLRFNLTERMALNLNGGYYYTQNEDTDEDSESEFMRAGSELSYKITIDHEVFISYRYSQDDQKDSDEPSAERNRVWAGIRLNFPM
jgi:hypothetical protein